MVIKCRVDFYNFVKHEKNAPIVEVLLVENGDKIIVAHKTEISLDFESNRMQPDRNTIEN